MTSAIDLLASGVSPGAAAEMTARVPEVSADELGFLQAVERISKNGMPARRDGYPQSGNRTRVRDGLCEKRLLRTKRRGLGIFPVSGPWEFSLTRLGREVLASASKAPAAAAAPEGAAR